jgi:NADH-quinone oxidoreductase subunit H
MRIGTVLISIGVILAGLVTHAALAYGVGSLVEEHWYSGASYVTNIIFLMLALVMIIATGLTLAERKWSALMQDRIGPNRARINLPFIKNFDIAGVPHVITDVVKMLTKEAFRPKVASKMLFNLAPVLAFAPVFALFAIVPAGPDVSYVEGGKNVVVRMVAANPDFGLLYMFAIASLAVYGTSLAGWASNNKFALLGGVRASSQMISYEVALGLSLVGMMIAFDTVRLAGVDGMSAMQGKYLWETSIAGIDVGIPAWGILLQPVGFLLFFAAAFAETKRAPFDSPEGESEIVGYFLEYSGMQFGMFMISEFVEVVVLAGVLVAIFFGGWHIGIGDRAIENWSFFKAHPIIMGTFFGTVFWIKVVLMCYLQLVIRWTFPRFRYDQIQSLGWKILLPAGLVNLFVSAALILWDPSLRLLALVGAAEIGVILFLTLTPTRQVRNEQAAHDAHGGHGHGDDDGHHAPALPH